MGLIFNNSIFFIFLPSLIIINQYVLIHLPAVVAASDVLSQGEVLNSLDPNSTLISSNKKFTLEFFTIKSTNLTYLGIRYLDNDLESNVWVANRNVPMNSSGSLIIDGSGTLKVISSINTTLFIVSNKVVIGSGISRKAMLDDSGNFVLYDVANGNRTLWQSFDHPTDTLVPGMKLGYNRKTKLNWTLTSWFSSNQIPASGDFTLKFEMLQKSPQLVIYRNEMRYWTSGTLDFESSYGIFGRQFFDGLGATFVSDDSGMYIANVTVQGGGVQPLFQLSSMGQLMVDSLPWMGGGTDFCHGKRYETSDDLNGGCVAISATPGCRHSDDEFNFITERENRYMLTGLIQHDNRTSLSLRDCMEICWNNCKCKAFSSSNTNGTGCTTWDGYAETNQTLDGGERNFGFLSSFKPEKKAWTKKIPWKWIVISVTIGLTCAYIVYHSAPWWYARIRRRILQAKEKRRRDDYIHQLTGSDSFNYGNILEKGIKDAPDIKIFSLGAILAATDSFSVENKLGQGGYGPVYKGKLFDGLEIAIKRLSKTSGQGKEEFKSELILISKLQHTNLVRLYGCCIHQEEKMLIYEFMPNKSLDFFLFAEDKKEILDWRTRFNIIEGVAQGLLYLHKYSRMRVIHRDLKASNILLDENMNPKIADFGMARNFHPDMTEAMTIRVVGTYGYMAPEYVMEGTFSIKSDVFSFGVLIIEIVSGRRNSRFHDLVKYAWEVWKRDAVLELKDNALDESFDLKQLLKTIQVGLLCVQDNADDRPTMLEVLSMLNNEIADLPNPERPLFITGKQQVEDSSSKKVIASVNGLSITAMEAR